MNCKYLLTLNGENIVFDSEQELSTFITNNKYRLKANQPTLVSYSKEFDRLSEVMAKILTIRDQIKNERITTDNLGATHIENSNQNRISVTRAITTRGFSGENQREFVTGFNLDAFKENFKQTHKEKGESVQEIELKLDTMKSQWESLGKWGTACHYTQELLFNDPEMSMSELVEKFKNSYAGKLVNFSNDIIEQCIIYNKNILKSLKDRYGEGTRFIPELKISYKNALGQTVVGKIDLLIITKNGDVHIADFKTSPKYYKDYSLIKSLTFKYQLEIYRQMLSLLGINTSVSELLILPILFKNINPDEYRLEDISTQGIIDVQDDIKAYVRENVRRAFPDPTAYDVMDGNDFERFDTLSSELFGYDTKYRVNNYATTQKPREKDGEWIFRDHITNKVIKKKTKAEIDKAYDEYQQRTQTDKLMLARSVANYYNENKNANRKEFTDNIGAKAQMYNHCYKEYLRLGWELDDKFINLGVLVFRNRDSKVIDFVHVTNANIQQEVKMAFGQGGKKITGNLLYDTKAEENTLSATLGNIELMRLMLIANEYMPNASGYKLNQVKVVTEYNGFLVRLDMDLLIKNFNQVVRVANNKKNLDIKNNFSNIDVVNPIDRLKTEIFRIASEKEDVYYYKDLKKKMISLESMTRSLKILALLDVAQDIDKMAVGRNLKIRDPFKNPDSDIARLYYLVYDSIRGIGGLYYDYLFSDPSKLAWHSDYTAPTQMAKSPILREVYKKVIETTRNKIVNDMNKDLSEVKVFIENYMKTLPLSLKNADTSLNMFDNLLDIAETENDAFIRVKNPYLPSSETGLTETLKTFLKKWLETINAVRFKGTDGKYQIGEEKGYVETGEWFNVPLMRGGMVNRGVKGFISNFKDMLDKAKNPMEFLSEKHISDANIAYDQFQRYINPLEINGQDAANMIRANGANYYSRDLSEVLVSYLWHNSMKENYEQALPYIRSAIVCNEFNNMFTGNELTNLSEAMYLRFLSEIYKKNLDGDSKLMNIVKTFAGVTSNTVNLALLAVAPKNFIREIGQGFYNNVMRGLTKFWGEDGPSMSDLNYAYAFVSQHGATGYNNDNLMTALAAKFNISGRSMSELKETHRASKSNFANMFFFRNGAAFAFNNIPDYLHRMSLFIAYIKKVGALESLSYDEVTQLVIYDFDKDKRFECVKKALKGEKLTEKDLEHLAEYKMMLNEFNENRADEDKLKFGDALPEVMTSKQITTIKNIANQIHGNMDSDSQMLLRRFFLGSTFSKYLSFASAKVMNWFALGDRYMNYKPEDKIDSETGKLFYYRMVKDPETGEMTMEETTDTNSEGFTGQKVKVLNARPEIGAWQAIVELFDIITTKDEELRQLKKEAFWEDEARKAAIDFAISDLLAMLMLLILTGGGVGMLASEDSPMRQLRKEDKFSYDLISGMLDVTQENNPINLIAQMALPFQPIDRTVSEKLVKNTFRYFTNDNYETKQYLYNNFGFGKFAGWIN